MRVPLFCAVRLPGGSSQAADEGGSRGSGRQHSQQGRGGHQGQAMPYNVSRQRDDNVPARWCTRLWMGRRCVGQAQRRRGTR